MSRMSHRNDIAHAHHAHDTRAHAQVLSFEVHSWSSFSANFTPENILVDRPCDQSSRWLSGSNNSTQFITCRFSSPVILSSILFGKYHKMHVCNLKEFKVFGGMSEDKVVELLHSGLRNDDQPEVAEIQHA